MADWGEQMVQASAVKGGATGDLPFMGTLGLDKSLDLVSVDHGKTVFCWETSDHLVSMDQILQGGTLGVVADICQGQTYMSHLETFHGFSTTDLNIRFLAPVRAGETLHVKSQICTSTMRLTLIETLFVDTDGGTRATAHGGWRPVKRAFAKTA